VSGIRNAETLRAAPDRVLERTLERVYAECHRIELIDPDPLLVVRDYPDPRDREIAALFCASFALGRARSIVAACRTALAPFGPRLVAALSTASPDAVLAALDGFAYRFFDARDAACLLAGAASVAREAGSLEGAFTVLDSGASGPESLLARCDAFVDRIRAAAAGAARELPPSPARRGRGGAGMPALLAANLLPAPRDGSACKRLMLFLRWMVRRDEVDPGGWTTVRPSELILPLDVHLHRISLALGLTTRRIPDLRAALEATASLRAIDPEDPVRFDFALARLGIRSDYSLNSLKPP